MRWLLGVAPWPRGTVDETCQPLERIRADLPRSGREDSNLRHSAPRFCYPIATRIQRAAVAAWRQGPIAYLTREKTSTGSPSSSKLSGTTALRGSPGFGLEN